MLRSYLPALVFVAIGAGVGLFFAFANARLGARERRRDVEPYECGLPSEVRRGFRFGIHFYLVAILFIIFDIEVILLLPVSLQVQAYEAHALGAIGLFLALLFLAFGYEWRRGSLEWREGAGGEEPVHSAREEPARPLTPASRSAADR